jgi:hypothetical protein
MPATTMLVFVIFVDPCLVKRTKLFRQPSGSDEGTDDDHATGQPQTAQDGFDPIASGSAADGYPRQSIPFGTPKQYLILLLQGWVEHLRNPSITSLEGMGFAALYPSYEICHER